MPNLFMGLDYGTGGGKACLIDDQGKTLAHAVEEYPILNPAPGWSEHDAANYWEAAIRMIRKCLEQSGASSSDIRGIAISSALPSMVMIDEAGNPLGNAYNLMDRRATREVDWLKEEIGERHIFEISGNRLDDHPALVNLLWERNNRPETYRKIARILTVDGFISRQLTGRTPLPHSNAAFFGVAYDIVKREFNEGLLDTLGIDRRLLPDLHSCTDIIGEVTPSAAGETGLKPGIPVAAGQADFNAACIASGVIDEGEIQCNLGSCGNFGIIHKDTTFAYEMIALAFTVGEPETYITIPTTTTGGQSLRFLRDTFGQAELMAQNCFPGADAYDLLNQQAAEVEPGSEGLIVLPYLMGERTPIWDPHARGCIFGLSLNHTKGHVVRATMEGVAYALYDSFRIIRETGRKVNGPIVMHEGGAKSDLWRRIITDVFNVPTVLTKSRVGAPRGDAILAGVATGYLPDFAVAKQWVDYIEPMEPDPETHDRYMEYFSRFKSLYTHLREDYRALACLREGTLSA